MATGVLEIDKKRGARKAPTDWREALVYAKTKNGDKIASVVANIITILSCDEPWVGVIGSNTFAGDRETILRSPPWETETAPAIAPKRGDTWTDSDDTRAAAYLQRRWSLLITPEAVGAAVRVIAQKNPFHPVVEYLDSLIWDGTPRVSTWLTAYLGVPANAYSAAVGRWWLVSAVARVRTPGCKADHVIIFEGKQGTRKSTGLSVLAGAHWFSDELPELGSKDSYGALQGRWIIELAELNQLNRAETARAKAFFSATVDHYRPPYARRVITAPRHCVFAGTVNLEHYLKDDTGNRRFWPVSTGEVDIEALGRDRDQIWAEANRLHADGAKWWPSGDEHTMVGGQQDERYAADAWESCIEKWVLSRGSDFTVGDVLGGPLGIEPGRWSRADQMRVASCLRRLGCKKQRTLKDGVREWRWIK
jgi:putative DNA primase/helicase